ncbi:MAG: S8 family serine peptidase, partial [Promethearchaeota archaeon]
NLLLLICLLISLLPVLIFPKYNVKSEKYSIYNELNLNSKISENEDKDTISQDLNFNTINPDLSNLTEWKKMILKFDRNRNGISDQFESKLNNLEDSKSSNLKNNKIRVRTEKEMMDSLNSIRYNELNPIVQNIISITVEFPNSLSYSLGITLFEKLSGKVESNPFRGIYSFNGEIKYELLFYYRDLLEKNGLAYLIKEDSDVKANLYYASRNLRLRPYVWKSLNYTGDDNSSIAIIDTGIDDTHEFFDNFSSGNFDYKIVAWNDEINISTSEPYDDNGHGSHVAGIAAGVGTPVLDGLERLVVTETFKEDFYPYIYYDDSQGWLKLATFKVTNPGTIEVECNFTDYTLNGDRIYGRAALFYSGSQVDIIGNDNEDWYGNLSFTVSSTNLGDYELRLWVYFDDMDPDADPWVQDPIIRFRGEIHYPFTANTYDCGNLWKGVAPDTHLVGVKVLNNMGRGSDSDIENGITWVRDERTTYNITVASMSFGGSYDAPTINIVNELMNLGVIPVIAAGNDGAEGYNYVGSPGLADMAITVAAMNYKDQVTKYSSQGGTRPETSTTKPDILAPGGSVYDLTMLSADTNDKDGYSNFTTEFYYNELKAAQGTSMATPIVAGAANLLVQAMGGGNNWNWTSGVMSKLVKAILLMTATETYPLLREENAQYSPTLDRGGKDVHEGYGRINIDAALEAWTNNLTDFINSTITVPTTLKSSYEDPYGKHAYAGYVNLEKDNFYSFQLSVPIGKDYDLHLYNNTPNIYGEPSQIAASISSIAGQDEFISFKATHTGKFFIVIKVIGQALPPDEEDDDDDDIESEVINILEFLLSPLGLLIIGTCVAVVIVIAILAKRSSSSGMKEKERIRELMDESYY